MTQTVWITPPGSLGTIPEGVFYEVPLEATSTDGSPVYFQVIAGKLAPGIEVADDGLIKGVPKAVADVAGVPLQVPADVTNKFAIRAYTVDTTGNVHVISSLSDRTFSLTVSGAQPPVFITPQGQIGEYYDGNQIAPLQIDYTTNDIYQPGVITLTAGQLPPGLTISTTGLITGFIEPNTTVPGTAVAGYSVDGQGFDQYPYDFSTQSASTNYSFTLTLTNGTQTSQATYSIYVISQNDMTADTTLFTADNTFITADVTPYRTPFITNPTGSIGTVRNDNYYAYQFYGMDLDGTAVKYRIDTPPPGLTLDPNSGWLYGFIPNTGLTENTYTFNIRVYNAVDEDVISPPYTYSLTIQGPISSNITWLVPNNLGTIDNGGTSLFYVAAYNSAGLQLQYRLDPGTASAPPYNLLPQGLELLPSGDIVGRVSFDTFALDGGTTTFDKNTTTFDLVFTFTVNAYSLNGVVNVYNTFTITVNRKYQTPYNNLYIKCMPPESDRALINSLIQNNDIFPQELIYRSDDPNFGVSQNVIYYHAYGLNPDTLETYVESLNLNHYWKNLTLGEIKTAQALDPVTGEVIYECVYSEVVDDLVNVNTDQSVGKEVTLAYPIENDTVDVVYPNSLSNMRNQVIDVVGQESNVLPLWMLSKQANGTVLGFTRAWVIAYCKPGAGGQVAYNINTKFGNKLNLVDFEADRYELDCLLTKNWDPYTVSYNITNIVGNGTQVTVTYDALPSAPYVIGQRIQIAGVTPASYNGQYFITNCTTTQVTYNSITTATWVSGGTVSNLPGWRPSPPSLTTFDVTTGSVQGWVNNSAVLVAWVNDQAQQVSWTGNGSAGQPGTIFDQGSMQFIAPVDMYSTTDAYDRYLMFPKRNIIQNIEQINGLVFVNEYSDMLQWITDSNQPLIWITANA